MDNWNNPPAGEFKSGKGERQANKSQGTRLSKSYESELLALLKGGKIRTHQISSVWLTCCRRRRLSPVLLCACVSWRLARLRLSLGSSSGPLSLSLPLSSSPPSPSTGSGMPLPQHTQSVTWSARPSSVGDSTRRPSPCPSRSNFQSPSWWFDGCPQTPNGRCPRSGGKGAFVGNFFPLVLWFCSFLVNNFSDHPPPRRREKNY